MTPSTIQTTTINLSRPDPPKATQICNLQATVPPSPSPTPPMVIQTPPKNTITAQICNLQTTGLSLYSLSLSLPRSNICPR